MENNEPAGKIPEQVKGSKTDTQTSKTLNTEEEARQLFGIAKQKLLNVSKWHTYAGAGTADFQLTDREGAAVTRLAQKGDHFRINIPGPGSKTGDGDDWVQIQEITDESTSDSESAAIRVGPATNPQNSKKDVAHFFKEDASSTFIVQRRGKEVSAEVHGRNEEPNTEAEDFIDKARNLIVAAGAIVGLSEVQWKSLVNGLLDPNID